MNESRLSLSCLHGIRGGFILIFNRSLYFSTLYYIVPRCVRFCVRVHDVIYATFLIGVVLWCLPLVFGEG